MIWRALPLLGLNQPDSIVLTKGRASAIVYPREDGGFDWSLCLGSGPKQTYCMSGQTPTLLGAKRIAARKVRAFA